MAASIKGVNAREILDSRGEPTIATSVFLSDGSIGIASCPSGASVGSHEAFELRDNDTVRYNGKGVLKAIENVEKIIAPKMLNLEAYRQSEIDALLISLDNSANKQNLGANAMLSFSVAVGKAAAKSASMPLYAYIRQLVNTSDSQTLFKIPTPVFNLINGGKHADNNVSFQEYLIIPASAKEYSESLMIGVSVYSSLKKVLASHGFQTLVGDEGGFAPKFSSAEEGFSLLSQAVLSTPQYRAGLDVFFGLDAASTSFFSNQKYAVNDKKEPFSAGELLSFYQALHAQFPLLYLEDPFAEDDWDAWQLIVKGIGKNTLIVGDDLTVTNPYRLGQALEKKAITGIIIKPNQIGTLTESLAVVEMAKTAGLKIVVSHRSGETNDEFIADFAVAVNADYAKFGAPARGERVAKYNRLLEIEYQLKAAQIIAPR